MKQLNLIPKPKRGREHGGSLLLGRRRKRRPLCLKSSHHLTLRSDFAYGQRRLTRHRPLIKRIVTKASRRFEIKVYELAIVGNHVHILVKGRTRLGLQNFFRVVAGHIAQEILRQFPIGKGEEAAIPKVVDSRRAVPLHGAVPRPTTRPLREKENKFWQVRIYSRIVSWGREFAAVKKYVFQNTLEAFGISSYKPRRSRPISKAKTKRSTFKNTS